MARNSPLALCELDILQAILTHRNLKDFDVNLFFLDRFAEAKSLTLHHAARVGDLITVKKLVRLGSNVNEKDLFGSTPLHMAAMYGHKSVAEYLIQKGADLNAKTYKIDDYGLTPLDLAAQYSPNADTFSYLLSKGADPQHWDMLMYTLLDNADKSNEQHNYKAFDLALNKVEIAAQNKNALWVYANTEVRPLQVLLRVFASEITDIQYYNRVLKAINSLSAQDKYSLSERYIHAKNLLHAFPSNQTYIYKIGPNKVKITASGYYAVLSVDLAAKILTEFQNKKLAHVDSAEFATIKSLNPTSTHNMLISADNYTQEKRLCFQHVGAIFKQAADTVAKAGLIDVSQELYTRYQNGETLLLPAGWDGHALDIIVDKSLNLFMVANAGERFEGLAPGLNAFSMQFLLTADTIYEILNNQEQIELEFQKFYDLGLEVNETYSIMSANQEYGNCAWFSQQIAQQGLLFIDLVKSTNDIPLASSLAKKWYTELNEYHLTTVLKEYLADPFLEVAALGDILIHYHKDLDSSEQKERTKLILDFLTEGSHSADFKKYYQTHLSEITSNLKNFIAENDYDLNYFPFRKGHDNGGSTESIHINDVIQSHDGDPYILTPVPALTIIPPILIPAIADEHVITIL
ncbi:MAG: ankyrin repeat domain-containing protein [Candidatus Berkiella sp.]